MKMEYFAPENASLSNNTRILCCQCAVPIEANPSNMCVACLRAHVDITDGIPKQATLFFCRGCERYLQPPSEWVVCALESRELLALCLKRLKGLSRVKLIDAGFAWTEPHSKRIKVKLTVQGEVIGGAVLQQTFIVEFTIQHQMCDACHRSEAQDYWRALVQVRQRANNRKTFYYLEQLILKHKAHENTLGIKPKHDGLDFFYSTENHARKMVDFIQSVLPIKCQHSKKLISHDIHSNIYNYKFTFSVEIVPLSKDSVVCLPKKLTQQLGSISPICLVHRVTSTIHLIDANNGQVCDVSSTVYWRNPFSPICNPKQLVEYIVMDIDILKEHEKKSFPGQGMVSNKHVIADVWIVKASELGMDISPVHTRTHLGHILKPGDTVLGYNLSESNVNDTNFDKLDRSNIPDVFLVKKFYGEKSARRRARAWKLKHMAEEFHEGLSSTNDDYNDFLDDLEEDPAFRQNVNIFKDTSRIAVDTDEIDPSLPRITLAEMLDDLTIEDVEMSDVEVVNSFTRPTACQDYIRLERRRYRSLAGERPAKMKFLVVVLVLVSSSFANRLISLETVEDVLKKILVNDLSEEDKSLLEDIIEILHRPEYVSENSIQYASPTRTTLDCVICRSAFRTAIQGLKAGQTEEELSNVISTLCITLGIAGYGVCKGAVSLNIPIIRYIVKNEPQATAEAFCGLVLQNVGNPNNCPFDDQRFEWEVTLPAPPAVEAVPVFETKPLTIAIITDAHLDPLYEAFGVADCDEPVCCRIGQRPASNYIYKSHIDESVVAESLTNVTGEIKLNLNVAPKIRELRKKSQTRFWNRHTAPAGYWGDYRNCDSPIWAFDDVIDRIAETHKNIDVLYYIGDTIDHGVWETSYELINDMNRYLIEKIRKTFGDDVQVIPVLGNHESQPTNQFAPSRVIGDHLNTTWLYEGLVDKWGFYLTEDSKRTLLERGEFSQLVRPGLRVIVLNNNVAYRYNWWLVYDPLDAKKHLDWLVEELYKAEIAGEKVHILAHIPPGVHDLTYTWTREYNKIVNRFTNTIAAEFNGHTHSDEFKVFYNQQGTPINVAWGGGSATSYTFYNLNYKIATINTRTFEPLNIVNYAYNLTEANLTPNRRPHWFQLYDMKNTFGLTDLSAVSMNDLVYKMVTTNKEYLEKYAAFYSKLSDTRWPNCNINCKLDNLCKIVVTVLWERQRCEELRQLYSVS